MTEISIDFDKMADSNSEKRDVIKIHNFINWKMAHDHNIKYR